MALFSNQKDLKQNGSKQTKECELSLFLIAVDVSDVTCTCVVVDVNTQRIPLYKVT
jgi:hypothetical protein